VACDARCIPPYLSIYSNCASMPAAAASGAPLPDVPYQFAVSATLPTTWAAVLLGFFGSLFSVSGRGHEPQLKGLGGLGGCTRELPPSHAYSRCWLDLAGGASSCCATQVSAAPVPVKQLSILSRHLRPKPRALMLPKRNSTHCHRLCDGGHAHPLSVICLCRPPPPIPGQASSLEGSAQLRQPGPRLTHSPSRQVRA
jgi:hypothetical protein